MNAAIGTAGGVLIGYALGSIPFALLIARSRGIDIRVVGSGNVGATNVFRCVGKGWGVLTFVLDALKGWLPAAGLPWLAGRMGCAGLPDAFGLLCGAAAIAGHTWPVYIGFKGGKGVATSAGVLLGVAPLAGLIGLVSWILLFALSRYVSVASIGAAVAAPAAAWWLYADRPLLPAVFTLLGLLIVARHRSNIRRLMRGEEHRAGARGGKRP